MINTITSKPVQWIKQNGWILVIVILAIIIFYAARVLWVPGDRPDDRLTGALREYAKDTTIYEQRIRELTQDKNDLASALQIERSRSEQYLKTLKKLQGEILQLKQQGLDDAHIILDLNIFEQYIKMSELLEDPGSKNGTGDLIDGR